MITVAQIQAAIERLQPVCTGGLAARVAILVTFEELDAIMDEIESGATGIAVDGVQAKHIREGRAMLFINSTPILPELPPANAGPMTFDA